MPNLIPPFKLNYDFLDSLHENKNYSIYSPTKIPKRKHEDIEVSDCGNIFRLKDKQQLDIVSVIVLEKMVYHGNEFKEVKWTNSLMPKRKLLSFLFDLLLIELNLNIISDNSHTSPGSKEFWLSIGKQKKYDLYVYNIISNYKRRYKNVKENKIWGISNEYLDEINASIIGMREIDNNYSAFGDEEYDISGLNEEYEFSGFEEFDEIVRNTSIASNEIYEFILKFENVVSNMSHIRLIAQNIS